MINDNSCNTIGVKGYKIDCKYTKKIKYDYILTMCDSMIPYVLNYDMNIDGTVSKHIYYNLHLCQIMIQRVNNDSLCNHGILQ